MIHRSLGHRAVLSVLDGYNPTVDYLRLLSAVVIVQFHSQATLAPLGESAVGFFVICMVWFSLKGLTSGRPADLGGRARKLMYPFFVWAGLMIACKLGHALLTGRDPVAEVLNFVPPGGSFSQLWFLPWAVLVTWLLALAARHLPMRIASWGQLGGSLALLGAGSALLLEVWAREDLPLMLRLSALYLPSVGVGMMIFAARGDGVLLLAGALGCCVLGLVLGAVGVVGVQQFLFAPLLMAAALMVRGPEFAWTRRLGQISMDLYLVHVLVIAMVYALPMPRPGTMIGGIAVLVFSFAMAAVMQIKPIGNRLR